MRLIPITAAALLASAPALAQQALTIQGGCIPTIEATRQLQELHYVNDKPKQDSEGDLYIMFTRADGAWMLVILRVEDNLMCKMGQGGPKPQPGKGA